MRPQWPGYEATVASYLVSLPDPFPSFYSARAGRKEGLAKVCTTFRVSSPRCFENHTFVNCLWIGVVSWVQKLSSRI